jgi:hypothetical protein
MGFDSECDLAVEALPNGSRSDDISREAIALRNQLLSEHLGVPVGDFEHAVQRNGSLRRAVEELLGDGKTLRPFTEQTIAGEASPLAENDLMDPDHVPRSLSRSVQRFIAGLRR